MNQLAAPRQYTADDLLLIPDGFRFELIDGQLVERKMGAKSAAVNARLLNRLGSRVDADQLGVVFSSEVGYQIFPDRPNRVRFADGSFIARGRLPEGHLPDGHLRIVPDMMLEGVSPNDLAYEVEEKIDEYLQVGLPLLWVIYPDTRTVYVYRQNGSVRRLKGADELTGEDVIPGFSCRVEDLFRGF